MNFCFEFGKAVPRFFNSLIGISKSDDTVFLVLDMLLELLLNSITCLFSLFLSTLLLIIKKKELHKKIKRRNDKNQ